MAILLHVNLDRMNDGCDSRIPPSDPRQGFYILFKDDSPLIGVVIDDYSENKIGFFLGKKTWNFIFAFLHFLYVYIYYITTRIFIFPYISIVCFYLKSFENLARLFSKWNCEIDR